MKHLNKYKKYLATPTVRKSPHTFKKDCDKVLSEKGIRNLAMTIFFDIMNSGIVNPILNPDYMLLRDGIIKRLMESLPTPYEQFKDIHWVDLYDVTIEGYGGTEEKETRCEKATNRTGFVGRKD